MNGKILYLGDDDQQGAAIYLSGVMRHFGLVHDHVPSDQSPGESFLTEPYSLYVVSDYPASNFSSEHHTRLAQRVAQDGAGLLMIGGWESYHGLHGEHHDTPLATLLPVRMQDTDDRRNCAQPCLARKCADHEILDGLPFDASPPGIGGYNLLTARHGAQTILECVQHRVERKDDRFHFTPVAESPLLILGETGHGRVAALATDVAPHWVGGLVDWGDERVTAQVGEGSIEVGNWYARFLRNLLVWTGKINN